MNQNNHRPYLGELNDKQEATKLPRLNFYRRSRIIDQTKLNVRCRTGIVSIKEAQLCGRSSSIIIPNDSEIIFQDPKFQNCLSSCGFEVLIDEGKRKCRQRKVTVDQ